MPTPVWPAALPEMRVMDYGVNGELPIVKTPMESGRSRAHRVSKTIMRKISCSFVLTPAKAAIFWNFFENDANAGADWFYVSLLTGNAIAQHLARFDSHPSMRPIHIEAFEFTFVLETDQQVII
jgi:hypothetical protein